MYLKILIITSLTFFTCKTIYAQEIKWGAKVGGNLSTFRTNMDGEDFTSGLHVGAVAEIEISDRFSLQPELFYSMEGAKIEDSYSFVDDGTTYKLDYKEEVKLGYIQLPIMVRYKFAKNLSLEAGPQMGYLLSAKTDYEFKAKSVTETINGSGTEKITDEIKSIDFGVNLGIGYDFKNNLFIQGRYHLGLVDIVDSPKIIDADSFNRGTIKNSSIQVSLGYKF